MPTIGFDLPVTRPAWDSNPRPPASEMPTLHQLSYRCNFVLLPHHCFCIVIIIIIIIIIVISIILIIIMIIVITNTITTYYYYYDYDYYYDYYCL